MVKLSKKSIIITMQVFFGELSKNAFSVVLGYAEHVYNRNDIEKV